MINKQKQVFGPEMAETFALQALGWIVADDDRLMAFIGLTGAGMDEIRSRAGEPAFLAGVLDFLLSDESLLTGFAEEAGHPPDTALRMRRHLPGAESFEG